MFYSISTKNSSQYNYVQGPLLLTIAAFCHKFWKPAEFHSETTKTLKTHHFRKLDVFVKSCDARLHDL